MLEVEDIRYSVGAYGGFLTEIPRRLGVNQALDASVDALTTAFSSVYTHQRTSEALAKYTQALTSLRVCLDDPAKSHQPETLCAIYLVMICQVGAQLPDVFRI